MASASYCVYERIGGWETLSAAVEALLSRLLHDTRIAAFFESGRESQLKAHMLEFMTCAFGGKDRFAASQLLQSQRDSLQSMGFGAEHFDIMLQHFKAVLDELSVPKEVAASSVNILRCNRYLFEPLPEGDGNGNGYQEVEVTASGIHANSHNSHGGHGGHSNSAAAAQAAGAANAAGSGPALAAAH